MYIAIPTYKRHDILELKTLSTLERGGISPSHIFIFVANEAEKKLYETIPSTKYHKIIVGKLGIANQRNFIKHYFPEGSYVVSIDDDIEGVYQLAGNSLKEIKVKPFFEKALEELKKENRFMWGIYPVFSKDFMKMVKRRSTGLSFIIGALHGYIVRYDKSLEPSPLSEGKEDYEQSILYYLKDGGILRFNNISIKTKYLEKGGLGEDRFERNKKSAKYLKRTYPNLVSIFHRKKGMTEIRLTRKK